MIPFSEIIDESKRAKEKYPESEFTVWAGNDFFEQCALMVCEAGEALQAANKHKFNGSGDVGAVRSELIQTAAMTIRVIGKIDESEKNDA